MLLFNLFALPLAILYFSGWLKACKALFIFYLFTIFLMFDIMMGLGITSLYVDSSYWHSIELTFPAYQYLIAKDNLAWFVLIPYGVIFDFFNFVFYVNVNHMSIALFISELVYAYIVRNWYYILKYAS